MPATFTPPGSTTAAPASPDAAAPSAGVASETAADSAGGTGRPRRVPFGEELPLFCERCGYALHGLPQCRCDRCGVLHFACPECGYHQPINTLRPAAQRIIARLRFGTIALWVLFKLNFFGWLLVGWFAMGVEWSYTYRGHYVSTGPNSQAFTYQIVPRHVDAEAVVAFTLFALGFGLFGRMLLLRWRRGWAVGLVLAALVVLAVDLAALGWWGRGYGLRAIHPLGADFHLLTAGTALAVVFGAAVAWPLWRATALLFLPPATARAMLDWQRPAPAADVPA